MVFNSQVGAKSTDASGNVNWTLANGAYTYRVERSGVQSPPIAFVVGGADYAAVPAVVGGQ